MFVKTLASVTRGDIAVAGQRAVDMAVLQAKEMSIPLSFVITNEAFEQFVVENKLQNSIAEALGMENKQRMYEIARQHILRGGISAELVSDIVDNYEGLSASESSSVHDLVGKSEAPFVNVILSPSHATPADSNEGIILNVRGLEELLHAVKECWACLFTPKLHNFRQKAGLSLTSFHTGIIVQQAGVGKTTAEALSAHEGNVNEIQVKSYHGAFDLSLGVEKDEFRLSKEYLKPLYQSIAVQTQLLTRDEEGKLTRMSLGTRGEEQKLDDRSMIEVGRLTKKASKLLDGHVRVIYDVNGESFKPILVSRMQVTEGSVKLASYQAEEPIVTEVLEEVPEREETTPVQDQEQTADVPVNEITVSEEGEIFETDEETLTENQELAGDVPTNEVETVSEQEDVTMVIDAPDNETDIRGTEEQESIADPEEESIFSSIPEDEETDDENTDELVVPQEEEVVDEISEEESAEMETPSIELAEEIDEPESEDEIATHVIGEEQDSETDEDNMPKQEITIRADDDYDDDTDDNEEESVEAESITEESEDFNIPEENSEAENMQSEDEFISEVPENDSSETAQDTPEITAAQSDAPTSLTEAYPVIKMALQERYEARFKKEPPNDMMEMFFELSSEVIIPHEREITYLLNIMERNADYTDEDEIKILNVVDSFSEQIR